MPPGGRAKFHMETPLVNLFKCLIAGMTEPKLVHQDSKKRLDKGVGDADRRSRFKERSKNLERGISAPALMVDPGTKPKPKAKAPLPFTEEEALTIGQGMGHEFVRKTYFQPTYCHHCADMLWGLKGQGFQCKVCNFVSHEKCIPNLKVACRHIQAERIQDPMTHHWTKPMSFKKKVFCNVCRKRINSQGVLCEVCKYYAHLKCQDNAFDDCKHCATYHSGASIEEKHHWIEGNLPASGRCYTCTKQCSTTECLSGFRCGWCGITVHSGCRDALEMNQKTCTYRDLWHMILVPKAITHRLAIRSHMEEDSNEHVDGGAEEQAVAACEEEDGEEDKDGGEGEEGNGKPILVVDGSSKAGFKKWRKNTIHPTIVTKKMTAAELLSISLRHCGISDDPEKYFLAEVVDSARGDERELNPSEFPYDIQHTGYGLLKLYIRHKVKEEGMGHLRVNNFLLETPIRQVNIPVTTTTTAEQIVQQALINFDLEDDNPADYCLVEVSQMMGLRERVLNKEECPWKSLLDLKRDSVIISHRQRYYVRHREGGQTSVYIGSIPKEVLKDKETYSQHVKKLLDEAPAHLVPDHVPYDKIQIGPAFPLMGGLFLEFPTFELAMRISLALEKSPSHPKIIMLPSIYPDIVSMDQEPLLVFVNGKSGGNQGVELLHAFRRHLNPHQVFDLANGGPLPGLYCFCNVPQFRVLIGGGDGTFGWVLAALQEMRDVLRCKQPPVALLPLGTGNDLARALRWGAGYTGEKVMNVLRSVEDANLIKLDRWNVTFRENASEKPILDAHSVVMNNYLGIGLDAAIALDFHLAREENPEKFSSRFRNKSVYLQLGMQKMISKNETSVLHRHINVFVDKKKLELPEVEGVVVLNIQSWGAGADAWGTASDPNFKPAAFNDGLLEIVGISGVVHMGQIQSGIRTGIRLGQGKEIMIEVLTTLPIQVDGEAWPQPPGVISLKRLPEQATMLQGEDKSFFARLPTKKQVVKQIGYTKQLSEPELLLAGGLSSRRPRVSTSPSTPSVLEDEGSKQLGAED